MCPSTDEWIDRVRRYYSAIKKNEIGLLVEIWTDLESVIQNEVSQNKKNKYHVLTHVFGI